MSNFDKDRFLRLRESAAVNFEFWRGTYQDLGPRRLAMTAVGTPGWALINGLPCLSQPTGTAPVSTTGVVDPVVDITGDFFVEVVLSARINPAGTEDFILNQAGPGSVGGFRCSWNAATSSLQLLGRNAAGAGVNYLRMPNNTLTMNKPSHFIIAALAGMTSGIGWVGGVPVTVSLLGPGVVVNCVPSLLYAAGGNAGKIDTTLIRVWQGTPTNADAACLYQAAKSLVGEV